MMNAPSGWSPHVQLVLCRLGTEDVSWAIQAAAAASSSRRVQLVIYNAGAPLATSRWPQEALERMVVRKLQLAGGHEAYCYLEHMQRTLKGVGAHASNFAAITIFAPALPRCAAGSGAACTPRIERALRAFDRDRATIHPNGYAPIEPAPITEFWEGMSRSLTCLPEIYSRISQGRDLDADSEFLSFSTAGSFAVSRRNLLSAPRGWLRRASESLRNASAMHLPPVGQAATFLPPPPARMHLCCNAEHTCMPWLLERLWPMMLGTPHRGCNGVRTGYCANEWAPQRRDGTGKLDRTGLAHNSMVPREGAGAIKLRLDVARVARVARFANDLTEEERTQLTELLAAERRQPTGAPAGGGAPSTCSTQLCAILALLDKARASDDSDFALYLASAVNTSEVFVAAERSQRRCRQLFIDKKVLLEGIERIHVPRNKGASAAAPAPLSREAERNVGQVLHSAIQKMYAACLIQMAADPRWYQRPFVYGFAKEPDRPLPNVA